MPAGAFAAQRPQLSLQVFRVAAGAAGHSGSAGARGHAAVQGSLPATRRPQHSTELRSHGRKAELHLGWPNSGGADPFYEEEEAAVAAGAVHAAPSQRFDVLGLGQAMVDFAALAEDSVLERLNVEKGARK